MRTGAFPILGVDGSICYDDGRLAAVEGVQLGRMRTTGVRNLVVADQGGGFYPAGQLDV